MRTRIATFVLAGGLAFGGAAAPAAALNPVETLCTGAGVRPAGINPCGVANKAGGGLVSVGKKLVSGHPGAAVGAAAGAVGSSFVSIALTGVSASVLGAAKLALDETGKVLGATTNPQLRSTWFSGTYWRMAGISAVLTLPFLFAAAVQALLRTDLSLLVRAAFMHLPLAMLVVSIAAPLTMLLLAASDEMSAIVSSAAGDESAHFLSAAALTVGGLSAIGSPFLGILIGVFTVAGAVVLWIELLMRETAVYVIVLMLPLAFAAFVWPARRVWAIRTLELLGALILSKFAIVAVLSLGGAALGSDLGHPTVANWLAGLVLVLMAAFMPWALLRLVPLAEVAGSAAGPLRRELSHATGAATAANMVAGNPEQWLGRLTGHMRDDAQGEWPAPRGASAGARGDAAATSHASPENDPGGDETVDLASDEEGTAQGPPDEGGTAQGAPDEAGQDRLATDGAGSAHPANGEAGSAHPAAGEAVPAQPATSGAAAPAPGRQPTAPSSSRSATAPDEGSELVDSDVAYRHRLHLDPGNGRTYVVEPGGAAGRPGAVPGVEPNTPTDAPDPLPSPQEDPGGAL
jgi:hypothetical protein